MIKRSVNPAMIPPMEEFGTAPTTSVLTNASEDDESITAFEALVLEYAMLPREWTVSIQ